MTRLFTLVAALAAAGPAAAGDLCVGDPAPKLGVKAFINGEPVAAFAPGTVYVLEFWATWCGHCLEAVPHVAALQNKHPAVVFIGVDVFEHQPQMVKGAAAPMTYRVALDDVPAGEHPREGFMAKHWLTPAEQTGIPATFIVDGTGKVAWIGHPLEMDRPLEMIAAGTWAIDAAAEASRLQLAHNRAGRKILAAAQRAGEKSPAAAVQTLEAALAQNSGLDADLAFSLFRLRLDLPGDDPARQLALAEKLTTGVYENDAGELVRVALAVVNAKAATPEVRALALAAAAKSDDLQGHKDPTAASVRAALLFAAGSVPGAVAAQERAVKLAIDKLAIDGAGVAPQQYLDALAKYKAARPAAPGK